MKTTALCALAALVAAPLPAAPVTAPEGRITFAKTFHDEGKVFEGSKLTHLFKFKNESEVTYLMDHLAKTCACAKAWLIQGGEEIEYTKVAMEPRKLPPGGEGAIKVLLDMTGIHSLKDGTATLRFTDPAGGHIHQTVKFQATGMSYFKVEPPSLTFTKMRWDEKKDFSFTVSSPHVEKWSITDWKSGLPAGVTLAEPEIRQGEKGPVYTFKGTLGPGLKPGVGGGTIKLETDFDKIRFIEFSLLADVVSPLEISRNHLGFGVVRQRRGKTLSFTLTCKDEKHPLQFVRARLTKLNRRLKYLDLQVEEKKPGREYRISLTLKRLIPKGFCKGEILLELSHPFLKEQRVDFGAIVR